MKLRAPVYQKRHTIVSGAYEPTDTECERAPEDDEEDENNNNEEEPSLESVDQKDEGGKGGVAKKVQGVPAFWLTCLKNVEEVAVQITEDDEKALVHLVDISVHHLDGNPVPSPLPFVSLHDDDLTHKDANT